MRSQPNRDYVSNDVVQTPPALAQRLVEHFKPTGRMLEPCKGEGNFLRLMPGAARCEISEGRDFLPWIERVDWIITNPPWSQIRRFLQQAMAVSDHVVFLLTINHIWTKARIRDIRAAGFGIAEIVLVDMPPSFPPSGFQLGAVHVARNWQGPITLTDFTDHERVRATRGIKARRPAAATNFQLQGI